MEKESKLLAYCGLYCGDCAGYSGEIAEAARNLIEVTERYKFRQTATHLFSRELNNYNNLSEMLDFMSKLKCPRICRQIAASDVKCEISKCCRERRFFTCHECAIFETCDKLKTLSGLHGDSHIKNLRAIQKMGVEDWIQKAKRLWFAEDGA